MILIIQRILDASLNAVEVLQCCDRCMPPPQCFSCVKSQVSCKHVAVCVLVSDCLEKQKKILHKLEDKCTFSETRDAKLVDKNTHWWNSEIPSPDDPHQTDKNVVAEHDNYWQIKNGEDFRQKSFKSCDRILMLLSTNPKDAITQEALLWIDRMSNETLWHMHHLAYKRLLGMLVPLWLLLLQMYVKKETRWKDWRRAVWKADSMLYYQRE